MDSFQHIPESRGFLQRSGRRPPSVVVGRASGRPGAAARLKRARRITHLEPHRSRGVGEAAGQRPAGRLPVEVRDRRHADRRRRLWLTSRAGPGASEHGKGPGDAALLKSTEVHAFGEGAAPGGRGGLVRAPASHTSAPAARGAGMEAASHAGSVLCAHPSIPPAGRPQTQTHTPGLPRQRTFAHTCGHRYTHTHTFKPTLKPTHARHAWPPLAVRFPCNTVELAGGDVVAGRPGPAPRPVRPATPTHGRHTGASAGSFPRGGTRRAGEVTPYDRRCPAPLIPPSPGGRGPLPPTRGPSPKYAGPSTQYWGPSTN